MPAHVDRNPTAVRAVIGVRILSGATGAVLLSITLDPGHDPKIVAAKPPSPAPLSK